MQHTQTHTHTNTHMYIYIHTQAHTYTHTYTHSYIHGIYIYSSILNRRLLICLILMRLGECAANHMFSIETDLKFQFTYLYEKHGARANASVSMMLCMLPSLMTFWNEEWPNNISRACSIKLFGEVIFLCIIVS